MLQKIFLRIDANTKRLITPLGYTLKDEEYPTVAASTELILCFAQYDVDQTVEEPLTEKPFSVDDLFVIRGDYDVDSTNEPMFLTEEIIGSPSLWTTITVYTAGNKVTSTAGDWYVCVTGGTSDVGEPTWDTALGEDTVDGTITWRRVNNNDGVNETGDWIDGTTADKTLGQASIRIDTRTTKFATFASTLTTRKWKSLKPIFQLFVLPAGFGSESSVLLDNFWGAAKIDTTAGSTSLALPNWLPASQINSDFVNRSLFNLKSALSTDLSSDAFTKSNSVHMINPQSGTTDDLATINGGVIGENVLIYLETNTDTITVKHGTGNIQTHDANDFIMSAYGFVQFYFDGSNWRTSPTAFGDMLKSVYDTGDDGKIDSASGGTNLDTSSATGIPRISSGTWSVDAQVRHEEGGLEADVSAYDGLVKISAGLTSAVSIGIADNNVVEIDSASVVDNDYAKFTANGLEGRSYSEVKTDLSLDNVENTALSTWAGSTNIVTLGSPSVQSYIDFPEVSTPTDPASNVGRLYVKDDTGTTKLYFRDSASSETDLLAGSDTNKVMVSANDTTPDYLLAKIPSGLGVTMTETGDGGDETLVPSLDINGLTSRTAFASGDEIAIYEAGVGIRKIDYDDLPGAGGGEVNTASNQGVGGVGVYDTKVSVDLQFRNINSLASGGIVVALDAGNKEIDLSLDISDLAEETNPDQADVIAIDDGTAPNKKMTIGTLRMDIPNDQTGSTYTLAITDKGKSVWMDNASANTLTIPTNASVAFPINTVIVIVNEGAGTTSVEGDTGVDVNGVTAGSGDITAQYGAVQIIKRATNAWIAIGAIGAIA